MTDEHRRAVEAVDQAHERATGVLEGLISAASADKVYSEPVVAGDRTVITAAELRTGMGFGYGLAEGRERKFKLDAGPRGGGGGGGQAVARPVAVVTIDDDGVTVQPVWDRTRIVVTALTALGAMGLMLIRRRRAA